ncbi:MAG TPA: alanine racemase [Gemmatimonadales bacterium]|nr:alanine racemase [Gemmatimonadales bacterium]
MELTEGEYAVAGLDGVRTPALLIYADRVDRNITATLRLLDGPNRWRPHLKTAKLGWTMERLHAAGVTQAKCATALELEAACGAGFEDVLLAYPASGPSVELIRAIAEAHPHTRVSALVEDAAMVTAWQGSRVGLFIDLNPGMNRTGALPDPEQLLAIAKHIGGLGLEWRGLHYYDGHASGAAVLAGYDDLLQLADEIRRSGLAVPEIVTAGTSAFPAALGYHGLSDAGYLHRLSPGTLVYGDVRSLDELPADAGYTAAALVLTRVVSHPCPTRITCDAGHKTVSADAGDPTCAVLGHADWTPRHPSEEHLPIDLPADAPLPARGTPLWLLPRHVCPTVNNFDHALIISGKSIQQIEPVTARGRHVPLSA